MPTAKQYFELSQLAQASYALWEEGVSINVLMDKGSFSDSQARRFLGLDENDAPIAGKGYTLLAHTPNDPVTGFSATVFRSNETGKITIAFRGTDGGLDIVEDGFLAVEGYARDQIYSLYNYVQRLLAPAETSVAQWVRSETFDPAGDVVISWALTGTADGLGVIPAGAQVDVTGHSLGGHLAMAASRLFPTLVDQVYTYNAPGFTNNAAVNDFFASLGGTPAFPAADITNLYADAGSEIITGLHEVPGTSLAAFIEDQGLGIPGNHGIVPLTDAFSLYALYVELAPVATAADMTAILKAGSSQDDNSLESTLDALRRILLGGDIAATVPSGNRETFYRNYYALKESTAFETLAGNATLSTLVDKSQLNLEALSVIPGANCLPYRYALQALNPFALLGADYQTLHNTGGQLNLYDPTTRTGTLTNAWLEDRSAFLVNKIIAGTLDSQVGSFPAVTQSGELQHFEDRSGSASYHVYVGANATGLSSAVLPVSDVKQILFGGDQADTLIGNDQADKLYGAAGNDLLTGAKGDDYLEGGYGNDTYNYTAGDGHDDLLDIDGQGRILYTDSSANQTLLTGGRQLTQGGTLYQSSTDPTIQYRKETNGSLTVVIGGADDITIHNYQAGDLGISLSDLSGSLLAFRNATRDPND
jgi:pimeloyl-ACP methyl ester carboxylesterase